MMKNIKLLTSFLICFLVAAAGSYVTLPSIQTWYVTLNKPFFSPPNAVFGPVWTILYILMAISLYLIWIKDFDKKSALLGVFAIQLILNFLWSLVFFYFHLPLLALIVIVLLWSAILYLIVNSRKKIKPVAIMLLPYLLWVSFASLLNLAIVVLNP